MAAMVAMAVRLTESSIFALASDEIKLETLPPGQAETNIIPKATLGEGLITKINRNVTAGNATNCENTPIIADLGFNTIFLNCLTFISRATPNIIKAMVMFIIRSPPLLKLSLTQSKISKLFFICASTLVTFPSVSSTLCLLVKYRSVPWLTLYVPCSTIFTTSCSLIPILRGETIRPFCSDLF